jgi:hypothetical protein
VRCPSRLQRLRPPFRTSRCDRSRDRCSGHSFRRNRLKIRASVAPSLQPRLCGSTWARPGFARSARRSRGLDPPSVSRSNRQLLERRLDVSGPALDPRAARRPSRSKRLAGPGMSIGRERNARSSSMTCARDSKPRRPSRLTYAFQLACARASWTNCSLSATISLSSSCVPRRRNVARIGATSVPPSNAVRRAAIARS